MYLSGSLLQDFDKFSAMLYGVTHLEVIKFLAAEEWATVGTAVSHHQVEQEGGVFTKHIVHYL